MYEITGTIDKRFNAFGIPKKDGSGDFMLRNFVLKTERQWQDNTYIEFHQFQVKNITDLDNIREGDEVSIAFVLVGGREGYELDERKGNYTEAKIWGKLKAVSIKVLSSHNQETDVPDAPIVTPPGEVEDDLPF